MFSSTVAVSDVITASQYNNARKDIIYKAGDYGVTTGSANAYVLSVDAQLVSLVAGSRFLFNANFTNTSTATLNVNGLGATSLYVNSNPLLPGQIKSGYTYEVVYDGTNFKIIAGNTDLGWIPLFTGTWSTSSTAQDTGVIPSASSYRAYKIVLECKAPSGYTTNFYIRIRANNQSGSIYITSGGAATTSWTVFNNTAGEIVGFTELFLLNRGDVNDKFFISDIDVPGYSEHWGNGNAGGLLGRTSSIDLTSLSPSTYVERFSFEPMQNNAVSAYAVSGSVTVFGLL